MSAVIGAAAETEICELQVHILSAPDRLAPMRWLLDALAGDLDEKSQFLDDVEQDSDEMCIYLYGGDPLQLVRVTRRVLEEFQLLAGTFGVLTTPCHETTRPEPRHHTIAFEDAHRWFAPPRRETESSLQLVGITP